MTSTNLTFRQQAAIAAMQALISMSENVIANDVAEYAVKCAIKLEEELLIVETKAKTGTRSR